MTIDLSYIDHVAIQVSDMMSSIKWYEEVLGMTKVRKEAWGEVPIFMIAGKAGVAFSGVDHINRC